MSTENPTDTNPALDSIIDSIAGNPAPSEDVAPAEPQATEVAATTAAATTPEPPKPPEPVATTIPVADPKFAQLAAQERAMRQRVADERSRYQAEYQKQAEEQLKAYKAQLAQRIQADPAGALKDELGITGGYSETAKDLWYAEMGKDAPPEAHQTRTLRGIQSQLAQVQQQLVQERQERQRMVQEQQQAQHLAQRKAWVSSELDKLPEQMKYTKAVATVRKEFLTEQLHTMATNYERTYGEQPSIAHLAEMLETEYAKDLGPLVEALMKTSAPVQTQTPATAAKSDAQTLTNTLNSVTKPRNTQLTEDELVDEVINDLKTNKHLS